MTSERILNAVAAFLRPKVLAAGGVFALSESVANTLSLLSGGAGRFRVIVQFQREAPLGDARGGRVLTLLIIVQHGGQNLSVNPGDAVTVVRPASLSATTADSDAPTSDSETASLNNAALMQRCSQVCQWARSIRFLNADIMQEWPQMKPGASYWLNDPSFPTRQIAHEFMVGFSLDSVTVENVTA